MMPAARIQLSGFDLVWKRLTSHVAKDITSKCKKQHIWSLTEVFMASDMYVPKLHMACLCKTAEKRVCGFPSTEQRAGGQMVTSRGCPEMLDHPSFCTSLNFHTMTQSSFWASLKRSSQFGVNEQNDNVHESHVSDVILYTYIRVLILVFMISLHLYFFLGWIYFQFVSIVGLSVYMVWNVQF